MASTGLGWKWAFLGGLILGASLVYWITRDFGFALVFGVLGGILVAARERILTGH